MAHAEVEERQLLKAMTWWDGFVVALANPGFLIAALGASIGVLGTTGAFVLWTISVLLGALQNNIYAEMATMFPQKAGGISLYAHEAWRKYLSLIGPVVTFGYWFAWSSVLAINGYIIGTLAQAEWFSGTTFTQDVGNFQWSLPVYIGIGCILAVWIFNIYGIRPAVWLSYVTGALLILPAAALMFLPYITGDWTSDNMDWAIGTGGGLGLAMTWLYFMGWSSYGFETVAAFAPEYHSPETDTPRALRASAAFSVVVYALLPLGLGGTLGTKAVASDATAIAFYKDAFDAIVGNALGHVLIACLIAGLLLSMNTATMDGSRALYGISQDGMTTKWLGRLNRYHVPAVAMTLDVLLNLWLISYFGYPLDILAAGNLGYMLAHVFALGGFLMLRRDRPNWPRPIRLAAAWAPIAALLAAINLAFIVVGGFIYSGGFLGIDTQYGYGWDKTRIGLIVLAVGLLLYIWRHVVEDRTGVPLREETPTMPPSEERAAATTAPAV
jgi:amino acid transporter